MIENDNQYVMTRRRVWAFEETLRTLTDDGGRDLLAQAQEDALKAMIDELSAEVVAYESTIKAGDRLRSGDKDYTIDTIVENRVVAHEDGSFGHFQAIAASRDAALTMRRRYLRALPDRELTNH